MKDNIQRKNHSFWLKAAICCAGYGIISDSVIIPLVTALFGEQGAFPQTSLFLQNFIISGNTVVVLFVSILTGILMKYISKRRLMIFGTGLFFVAGVGCAFANNTIVLAILRGLDSASDGILTVVSTAMIIDLFREEKEQGTMFGWYNAVSQIFGVLVTLGAGYAALYSWRYGFLLNGISIISVILCIIFIPETGVSKASEERTSFQKESEDNNMVFRPFAYVLAMTGMFLISSIMLIFAYMMDYYIAEKGFGNSVVTGYMSSASMLIGVVSSLIATPVLEKFKNKSLYVALIFGTIAAANIIYGLAHSLIVVIVTTIISGIFAGWAIVYYSLYVGMTVPQKFNRMCISIYTALFYLTSFVAPYYPVLTGKLFGDYSIGGACFYCGTALAIVCVLYLIRAYIHRNEPGYL